MCPRSPTLLAASVTVATLFCIAECPAQDLLPANVAPASVTLDVNAGSVLREFDPRMLGGTNIALWNNRDHFTSPEIHEWISAMRPGIIRLPGGSWANAHFWNGNGVRDDRGRVDPTKVGEDGYPAVDYSDYAPGFNANTQTLAPSTGYHGNIDVKGLSEWVQSIPGAAQMPCPNAGSGRPIDAAQWVDWSRANGFNAPIWEIGNELEGSWEPGYHLPHGQGTMTEAIFMERYNAIAKAMREVDPTIKIGACSYHEGLARDGGDLVDFIAIHNYWGSGTVSFKENLIKAPETVKNQIAKVRGFIEKYQPDRKDKIQVGYTEWNLAPRGLNCSDLFSGLWFSSVLSGFAQYGLDFATQWDIFTHSKGMKEGHGMIWTDGRTHIRKAGYFAMWLWNNFTGNKLLESKLTGPAQLHTLATKDDNAVYLMLLNPDEDQPVNVSVNLSGFQPAATGESVSLTHREYHWDEANHRPLWSQSPRVVPVKTGPTFTVSLPPFSVTHVRIPAAGSKAAAPVPLSAPVAASGKPVLKIVVPDDVYAGEPLQGTVFAMEENGTTPYPVALPPAILSASANAVFDRKDVRLNEAMGRFFFQVKDQTPFVLTAISGNATASVKISPKSSEPRPQMVWDFISIPPLSKKDFESAYELVADVSQRANREVARINLPDEEDPSTRMWGRRVFFKILRFPESVKKNNIRGIFFDMKSVDLFSDDPNASVGVVLQTAKNQWIPLGEVPFAGSEDWVKSTFMLDEKYFDTVDGAYNIVFELKSSKPVRGAILLDQIGLMMR